MHIEAEKPEDLSILKNEQGPTDQSLSFSWQLDMKKNDSSYSNLCVCTNTGYNNGGDVWLSVTLLPIIVTQSRLYAKLNLQSQTWWKPYSFHRVVFWFHRFLWSNIRKKPKKIFFLWQTNKRSQCESFYMLLI